MSLKPKPICPIPQKTARIAKTAFPKGILLKMSDELGVLYEDKMFADLFSKERQPALAPRRLTLITMMQLTKGLSDRQAADVVRARLDWKYALGLELEDSDFDFSVFCEFRSRLIVGDAEHRFFDTMLDLLEQQGLLKAGGRQRTDATLVVATIRAMNRVVCAGKTLRATLNSLAEVAPEWVRSFAPDEWYERYAHRMEEYWHPKGGGKRTASVETMGADGYALLATIFSTLYLNWLQYLSAVETLQRVWIQQFEMIEGKLHLRADDTIPPSAQVICSPCDADAIYGRKLTAWWVGYKVHLTESCDEDCPWLITDVETSRTANGDVDVKPVIHQTLKEKGLLPKEHLIDTNYVEAKQFVQSRDTYGIDLIAPTGTDNKWQAKEQ